MCGKRVQPPVLPIVPGVWRRASRGSWGKSWVVVPCCSAKPLDALSNFSIQILLFFSLSRTISLFGDHNSVCRLVSSSASSLIDVCELASLHEQKRKHIFFSFRAYLCVLCVLGPLGSDSWWRSEAFKPKADMESGTGMPTVGVSISMFCNVLQTPHVSSHLHVFPMKHGFLSKDLHKSSPHRWTSLFRVSSITSECLLNGGAVSPPALRALPISKVFSLRASPCRTPLVPHSAVALPPATKCLFISKPVQICPNLSKLFCHFWNKVTSSNFSGAISLAN